jgi:hypothetical protein
MSIRSTFSGVRRAFHRGLNLTPPDFKVLRRQTVWVVCETASPQRRRRRPAAAQFPPGWGELAGSAAQPTQAGAVALLHRVAPPRARHHRRTPWLQTEFQLGVRLPADYHELIDDRGPGIVADVVVYGPGARDLGLDLFTWHEGIRDLMRSISQIACEHLPPPLHPEPGGIIPWGVLYGNQIVAWATTTEDPDRWPVVVLAPDLESVTLHPLTATGYLLARLPGPDFQAISAV